LGCADVIKHSIVMEDERPVHQRQFRVPFAHEEVLYEYVDKLLKSGAIEVCRSPYNSAEFCVARKQLPNAAPGDLVPLRVVLDFRAVNLKLLPDRYCVKEVRECLDEVCKSRSLIFLTFDLTSGFWQQSLQEKSRQYTAFSVPGKGARYQWRVTPMGLQGWPASFVRLMDFVMTGRKGIITYNDDILVHLRDHEQHLKTIEEVLWRLRKDGLKLNLDKTIIGAKTVQYLGYTLSGQGVTLSKDKLAAIKDFPMPTSRKAIREFLRLANYFRLLIPSFSQTADQLNKMPRALTVWRTGAPPPPEAQVAFNKLKEALMSAPIVVNPKGGQVHTPKQRVDGNVRNCGRHAGRAATRAKGQDRKSGRVRLERTKGPRSELPGLSTREGRSLLGNQPLRHVLDPTKAVHSLHRSSASRNDVDRP
jgi:hypothetical protein